MRGRTTLSTFLQDLADARKKVSDLRELGVDLRYIQISYEAAIDDFLKLAGISERQVDLIWEITEPDKL